MFTDLDIIVPVRVAGISALLIAQRQHGRLLWALGSEHGPWWVGWAGEA